MAKNDKEFGKWISTTVIVGKLTVEQYEKGIVVKEKGKEEERHSHLFGATIEDVRNIINDYYDNLKK